MTYDGIQQAEIKQPMVMKSAVWNASLIFLVFSTVILLYSRTNADPDLWGHLRFGLDVLETGKLAHVDPYSFITTGIPWINHEWLAEVILGLVWTAGGAAGLVFLKLSVAIFTIGILFYHLQDVGFQPLRAGILILFVTLVAWASFLVVRPHMFTNLFCTVTIWVLYRAERGQYKHLWILPPIFALWANLHGGFLAGLGIVFLWALLHLIFNFGFFRQVIPPVIAILVATILNPYGLKLLIFLLQTATVPRPEITEWHPLEITSFPGIFYLFLFLTVVLALIYTRRERRIILVLMFFGMAVLPFMAVRHTVLSAMAIVVLSAEHLLDLMERAKPQQSSFQDPTGRRIFFSISIITALLLLSLASRNWKQIVIPEDIYPVGAVAILKESGVSGNLANQFNAGEYIIWHLGPKIKVMIDGRRETVYSENIYQKSLDFEYGKRAWYDLVYEYQVEMALVERGATHNLFLLKPGWLLIYQDNHYGLFVKENSEYVDPLQKAAAGYQSPTVPLDFPSK